MKFAEKLDKIFEEKIPGGKADGVSLDAIAKKHGVSVKKIERQHKIGMEIEKEHSPDPEVRDEIARDHEIESDEYYTGLKKMEDKLNKRNGGG